MSMTMTQKLLAAHANLTAVAANQLVNCTVDLCFGNDVTTPVAIDAMRAHDLLRVRHPERVAIVLDHFTPNKDIRAAELCQQCRQFATEQAITKLYDTGRVGIEHALLPELGLITAGDCVVGADSHTCTAGALGAFATGVGSTDFAAAMISGKVWFRVPPAIRIVLTGTLRPFVTGKDVILTLLGLLDPNTAQYASLEFSGDGVAALSMDDRFTIANMAIEAGAKNGLFPVDDQTRSYLQAHGAKPPISVLPDEDADYLQTLTLDLRTVSQMVACPPSPRNVHAVSETESPAVQQVFIGSCTNGRLSDLRAATSVLHGKTVADGVRCLIVPATQQIYLDALAEGLIADCIRAGCAVSPPTCGACLGAHMGVLAPHEVAISTTNRNFVGRMGDPTASVYLASPYVAAASALAGRLVPYAGTTGEEDEPCKP